MKIFGIIVLILIALGSLGYSVYVWQQNQSLSSSIGDKEAQIRNLNNEVTAGKLAASAGLKTNENVIPIREIGISITVPDSIKDLTYSYSSSKVGSSITGRVSFSTKTLTDSYASTRECGSFGTAPPLGAFSKVNGSYPKDPNADNSPGVLVKQFSSYYVAYSSPQAVCSSTQTNAPASFSEFKNSFSTIKEL